MTAINVEHQESHDIPDKSAIYWNMMRKDWSLNRWPLLTYLVLGVLSLSLLTVENFVVFHTGMVILLSAIVIIGAHLVFSVVINERSNKTILFMLSLPITLVGYTVAKLMFIVGYFGISWLILLGGIITMIFTQDHIMPGMLSYYVIVMCYLFVAFMMTSFVSIVMESPAWSIVVMSIGNICISIVMFATMSIPGVGEAMKLTEVSWSGAALLVVAVEVGLIVALVALTLFIQGKKTEFI